MAKITVNNISGLSDYGMSIKNFTDRYSSAINETARSFATKIEGSHAKAISAFLSRLNQMQTTVFDRYPAVLSQYASVILAYESALSDAGFQKKAWTDNTGAIAVSKELTEGQVKEIDEVKKQLQKVLNQASEALDYSNFDLRPGVDKVVSALGDAASQRKQKNEILQTAYDTFIKGLDSSLQALSDLEGPMANAVYTTQIPASTVITAIQNGTLTKDEMYYFDNLASNEDSVVLSAVLSRKKEDIEALVALYPNFISDNSYQILAKEISSWTNRNDQAGIEAMCHLMNGMGKKKFEENNIFLEKLAEAITEMAYGNEAVLLAVVNTPEFKNNPHLINTFTARELEFNNLMGFILGMQEMKYGKITTHTTEWKNNIDGFKQVTREHDVTGAFKYDDGGRIVLSMTHINTGTFSLSNKVTDKKIVDLAINQASLKLDASFAEYERLEQAKKEVVQKAIVDALLSIGKVAGNLVPGGASTMSVLSAAINSDLNSAISAISDGLTDLDKGSAKVQAVKSVSNSSTRVAGILTDLAIATDDYNKLTDKQKKEIHNIKTTYLGQGGYTISEPDSSKPITQIAGNFDYRAILRARELDEYGVTTFIKNPANGVDFSVSDYEKVLNQQVKSGKMDAKVVAYLLGKDSGLSFNTMTKAQLDELERGVGYLDRINELQPKESSKSTRYLDDFKGYISSQYQQIGNVAKQLGELYD